MGAAATRVPGRPIWIGAALVLVAGGVWLLDSSSAHKLEVQRPEPRGELAPPPYSHAPSVLRVPVSVELAALTRVVDEVLPPEWGSLDERLEVPEHDRLEVAVHVERGPLGVTYQDSTAILSTRLAYRARAWYDPPLLPTVSTGCGVDDGEPAPRIDASLVSPLVLDGEWRLRSEIRAGEIVAASDEDRDRCTVTILHLDMTDRVVAAARDLVSSLGPRADSALAEVDVRAEFADWWDLIAEPIRLDDDVWLVLAPEAVSRGRLEGTGPAIETVLTLTARPRVVLGERPAIDAVPLPPLGAAPDTGALVVTAEATADYDEIGERIAAELGGVDFSARGRTLRLRDVELSGVGDGRITVALDVEGDVTGSLYLVGTPVHDAASGQVTIPDLDFDVASRAALVSGAAFVARVGLIERIREYSRISIEPAVVWARHKVEEGFNARLSDDVRLEGSVESVEVVDLVARSDVLEVRARVRGRARLVVEGGAEQ